MRPGTRSVSRAVLITGCSSGICSAPALRLATSGWTVYTARGVVNVSPMDGRLTFPGGGYYHATKHAPEALTDALRFELAGFCVHAILIETGLIRSGRSRPRQEVRARRRERARPSGGEDEEFQARMAQEILRLLPGCPPQRARAIAAHAGRAWQRESRTNLGRQGARSRSPSGSRSKLRCGTRTRDVTSC